MILSEYLDAATNEEYRIMTQDIRFLSLTLSGLRLKKDNEWLNIPFNELKDIKHEHHTLNEEGGVG